MTFSLTHGVIQLLCGRFACEEGRQLLEAGRVALLSEAPTDLGCEAAVDEDGHSFDVTVLVNDDGELEARCTCPIFHPEDQYCKHIAAVLLTLHELRQSGHAFPAAGSSPADRELTRSMLSLFGQPPTASASAPRRLADERIALTAEWICIPVSFGPDKHWFSLSLKLGTKRLHDVPGIRRFLDSWQSGQPYTLSRHFAYEPQRHRFAPEDEAVLRELAHIAQAEDVYRASLEVTDTRGGGPSAGGRELAVPPPFWGTLQPLLAAAPGVRLIHKNNGCDGLRVADEPIPLRFEFDQASGTGYRLDVRGLERMTVMPRYGLVVAEDRLHPLSAELCRTLSELSVLLSSSGKRQIRIGEDQMGAFMEHALPGLTKLGHVHIAQAVSDRIVQRPLRAKLFLDRVHDKLLAGLEFHYGDWVVHPLNPESHKHAGDRLFIREGERERKILELMEQSAFTATEGGYYLNDEEAEFDFLHHTVPKLEKLAAVYATTAVKERLFTEPVLPKAKVEIDERTDWLELRFELQGIPEAEIRKLIGALADKRNYYRLPTGALLPLDSSEFEEIRKLMFELDIRKADLLSGPIRLPALRALQLSDAQTPRGAVKLGPALRRLLDDMRHPDQLDFPVPPLGSAAVLRDYQVYGYRWLKTLARYRFGGILADDMGLGKTVQSIAFIVSALADIRKEGRPALIVAPASLMYNWRNELKRFAPEVRAVIADGGKTQRIRALNEAGANTDVLITSYPLLRKDVADYARLSFHTLFLDEAQAFKNYTTQTAQAVKCLQARHRFALTGTPVENRLEELWSIFDAIFPGLFPGRRAFNEMPRSAIAKRARPFLLRRIKKDVLAELPEKTESIQSIELLNEQKKWYAAYLGELRAEALKHITGSTFQRQRIKILAGLTRLRQICCHPALFIEGYTGGSAKFDLLLELIEECRSAGKRMLVFSQFTGMLALIRRELSDRDVPYFYLDGQTPAAERVELCARFNEGQRDLFLISLKAGGTGLNLTGADTVILYDLWWNPAVEEQAADRAHRIGQKNAVQVIRLVAQGTVEDKMYALQQRKKHLIDEIAVPGEEAISALTEQEIREILDL